MSKSGVIEDQAAVVRRLSAEVERLREENEKLSDSDAGRWRMACLKLEAEIERLKDRIDQHHKIFEPMRAEIARLRAREKTLTNTAKINLSVAKGRLAARKCPECQTPARQIWIQEHATGCETGRAKPLPIDATEDEA